MAKPLSTAKQSVDLAATGPRVSKIRRDPPPVVTRLSIADRDDRDRRLAAVGILAFAIAIVVIVVAIGSYNGWSPSDHVVRVKMY